MCFRGYPDIRGPLSGDLGAPVALTNSNHVEWNLLPFVNAAGALEVIYLEREMGSDEVVLDAGSGEVAAESAQTVTIPVFLASSLRAAAFELGADLVAVSLSVDPSHPSGTSAIDLIAEIANRGTESTPATELILLDNGLPIGERINVPALPAGGRVELALRFPRPQQVTLRRSHTGFVRLRAAETGAADGVPQPTEFAGLHPFGSWQNPHNRFDVSFDDVVAPIDALLVINYLNQIGAGLLPVPATPPEFRSGSASCFS